MDTEIKALSARIAEAYHHAKPLQIEGGGSKSFLGNPVRSDLCASIDCKGYTGIIDYRKDELMIRVKAGTKLAEVESLLAENGQRLPFEPPQFAGAATIGGVVAAGLSGPARPYLGSVRDYVLGIAFIDGRGIAYEMGGQVMKNVAGYDVSRMLVGSLGEMGLICDVSLKVLPADEVSATYAWLTSSVDAIADFQRLQKEGLPLSGSAWVEGQAFIRLGGSKLTIAHAAGLVAGDKLDEAEGVQFWQDLKNQQLPVFEGEGALWRVSVEPGSDALLDTAQVIEWGGGVRWLKNPAMNPRLASDPHTVTLFRPDQNAIGSPTDTPYQHLSGAVLVLNQNLKGTFDPGAILNPGRLLATVPEY